MSLSEIMKTRTHMRGEIGVKGATTERLSLSSPVTVGFAAAWPILLLFTILLGAASGFGQTATWTGGNGFGSWATTNNWSPPGLPLNGGGLLYTVIVPDGTSLSFDPPGGGAIDALSFGVGSSGVADRFDLLAVFTFCGRARWRGGRLALC